LGAALCWGVGDFLGGLTARRIAVLTVIVVSQSIGLAGLALWIGLGDEAFPGVVEVLPAAGAGVAVLIGVAALYRGLAIGAMGIVAPISAAGPVVPLAVDAAHGTTPGALQWFGIGFVLCEPSRFPLPVLIRVAANLPADDVVADVKLRELLRLGEAPCQSMQARWRIVRDEICFRPIRWTTSGVNPQGSAS